MKNKQTNDDAALTAELVKAEAMIGWDKDLFNGALIIGWNAALKYCAERDGQWIPIHSEDDLPKEDADCFWTDRARCRVSRFRFYNDLATVQKEWLVEQHSAWMRFPATPSPYKENKNNAE